MQMDAYREPSFWSVIPDTVLSATDIKPNAKLLYAKVTSLQTARGYCYATNKYLADGLGVAPDTITRLLKDLSDAGYLRLEIVRDPNTQAIRERRIFPTIKLPTLLPPSRTNVPDPPGQTSDTPPGQTSDKRDIGLESKEENPPIAPQGAGCSRDENQKSMPKHKPERFEGFWKFYPRKEDRASAVRQWDRLKPSDELIDQMAKALKRQMQLPQWQDKTKIPYACRWLKNKRWQDECAQAPASNSDTTQSGWADDTEVL